ncbi:MULTISPECIES: hypothetical protein [Snodgrassella]|uniref:hypothetical protein n=1 Tax=Snodgrassella TaxID=1193515 RepID=UPI00099758C2|nr:MULTISPECIES: hypothetical protein [Snodgrassella]MBI0133447.1 hypothetical protein [Snodgrassella sp. W8132]OOX79700.1 hypothetical protein BGH94_03340 [Snodgrassella alvi]ORF02106.1 hypothetical protein BGH95_05465 [Snodgrassella alvi]PIT34507.1 hypothetical protein BHC50_01835 [Snodgrassella alvi]PIT36004.1 hypothetical protein BHC42_04385 [Snodgrassella alvi]
MIEKENILYRGLCLAKNDYFAAKISYTRVFGINIDLSIVIYRKDTWESYESFYFKGLASGADQKEWFKKAEKMVMQLDKPEDWKRPHRYCLALYAKQVLEDDFFRENLYFDKEINSKYIYNYTMTSRLKETVLIKKLNLLSEEEKKQLFILREWEKNIWAYEDIHYALFGREYLYNNLHDKEKFSDYYEKYNTEFQIFLSD